MLMYIYGDDSARSRAYLKQSIDQFRKQRDPAGYNTKELDGKALTACELWAEVQALPFMAEKRLVAVANALSSSDKELLGSIIEKIETKKIPEGVVIIFWQAEPLSKVKEAKELHSLLSKEKYAKEFEKLVGIKLIQWIEKEVQAAGSTIDPAAAAMLANTTQDSGQLERTINQLIAFKKGSQIDVAAVQEFIEEKIDDNVFAMVEALVVGDHQRCFKLLSDQRKQGEDDGKIFGLVLWQFRILLSLSNALEEDSRLTSDEAARRLKLHPFVAKKNFALVRRYTGAKLQALYSELLELDRQTKTGQADPELLMDLFVARV